MFPVSNTHFGCLRSCLSCTLTARLCLLPIPTVSSSHSLFPCLSPILFPPAHLCYTQFGCLSSRLMYARIREVLPKLPTLDPASLLPFYPTRPFPIPGTSLAASPRASFWLPLLASHVRSHSGGAFQTARPHKAAGVPDRTGQQHLLKHLKCHLIAPLPFSPVNLTPPASAFPTPPHQLQWRELFYSARQRMPRPTVTSESTDKLFFPPLFFQQLLWREFFYTAAYGTRRPSLITCRAAASAKSLIAPLPHASWSLFLTPPAPAVVLLWREFFYTAAYGTPNFDRMQGSSICRQIPWKADPELLVAWRDAKTGFPWIDAIMVQVTNSGGNWCRQNRVHAGSIMQGSSICRQIPWKVDTELLAACSASGGGCTIWRATASRASSLEAIWMCELSQDVSASAFFSRYYRIYSPITHLGWTSVTACCAVLVHWELGRDVFDRLLVDSDWAINNGNWLWLSASAFFSQYHRIYSPVTFGKKYDPSGKFIRHFLPVLKGVF
ncbi:unnamed protein product [Closterium sp. NIES-64]|nr:unnamed protein product [Closterium sp. NIES-64]